MLLYPTNTIFLLLFSLLVKTHKRKGYTLFKFKASLSKNITKGNHKKQEKKKEKYQVYDVVVVVVVPFVLPSCNALTTWTRREVSTYQKTTPSLTIFILLSFILSHHSFTHSTLHLLPLSSFSFQLILVSTQILVLYFPFTGFLTFFLFSLQTVKVILFFSLLDLMLFWVVL